MLVEPCCAPCFTDVEPLLFWWPLLQLSVSLHSSPPRSAPGAGALLQSFRVGCSTAPSALPLLWLKIDTACGDSCASPA